MSRQELVLTVTKELMLAAMANDKAIFPIANADRAEGVWAAVIGKRFEALAKHVDAAYQRSSETSPAKDEPSKA